MKKYIKASLDSGMVGIWWLYNDTVIGEIVPLDSGYNDGYFIHYDNFKNHMTQWGTVLQEQLPDKADELYPKRFKCLERGRVVYNIRTMSYEILCSEKISKDMDALKSVINAFSLNGCRYDIVADHHYYVTEPTGNPAIDDFEYGFGF